MLHGVRSGHHLSGDWTGRLLRRLPQPGLKLQHYHDHIQQSHTKGPHARRHPRREGIDLGVLRMLLSLSYLPETSQQVRKML